MLRYLWKWFLGKFSQAENIAEYSDPLSHELALLEQKLREEKARTELMAKITYTKWKLRKEEEKEYHLKYGVYLKLTTSQIQEDEFFEEMEWRMRKASLEYTKKQAELEAKQSQEERAKIEYQAAEKVIEILEEDFR